ncbi:hypothetical protein BpHYR1_001635 [Brachionus plicatilis]|uniref:Uncharacterized protein n=1 Tax=Brachionus plicatilis TaxID=10195 RepID=A0A3M7P5T3_BRAPC|nr:hypothetical protein BpHYR1_001635 [Brachionus plicatilis]
MVNDFMILIKRNKGPNLFTNQDFFAFNKSPFIYFLNIFNRSCSFLKTYLIAIVPNCDHLNLK